MHALGMPAEEGCKWIPPHTPLIGLGGPISCVLGNPLPPSPRVEPPVINFDLQVLMPEWLHGVTILAQASCIGKHGAQLGDLAW